MSLREIPLRIFEWFSRRAALREARAALAGVGDKREAAARQARLLFEVAEETSAPGEDLPQGSRQAAALSLYRQATEWARQASRAGTGDANPPGGQAAPGTLDAGDDDVARARAAAEPLIRELDAPRLRIERLLIQRWSRLALLGAAALLLVIGGRILTLGPDLAAGRPFRLSSRWSGFDACVARNGCNGLAYYTETEDNPWVEIDLGAPRRVRRIDVLNRDNGAADQATPLVAELSTDRAAWTEVARSDRNFGSWKASFPARTARFVRLRVPRRSVLHLQSIAVR
ncbi:MAG TPA: discoidin domain-containing protein [Polyangia bacterium]|nr:discoidin domain-containing protein [Polyangia bacterium]